MKRLIEFPLEDSNTILVEVDLPEPESGTMPAGRIEEMPGKAIITFEAALEKVRPAASAIIAKLRNLADSPDEIGVEFGIKLSAEAGAVVASAGIDANYKVTLKWSKK
jgi:hypothetical protein